MAKVTRGFTGRESRVRASWRPPGQYDVEDVWPVLSAELTPDLPNDTWTFTEGCQKHGDPWQQERDTGD